MIWLATFSHVLKEREKGTELQPTFSYLYVCVFLLPLLENLSNIFPARSTYGVLVGPLFLRSPTTSSSYPAKPFELIGITGLECSLTQCWTNSEAIGCKAVVEEQEMKEVGRGRGLLQLTRTSPSDTLTTAGPPVQTLNSIFFYHLAPPKDKQNYTHAHEDCSAL